MTALRRIRVSAWACCCQRCGHQWTAYARAPPAACSGCKARFWTEATGTMKRGRPQSK